MNYFVISQRPAAVNRVLDMKHTVMLLDAATDTLDPKLITGVLEILKL